MIYHIIRGHVLHTSPLLVKEIITLSEKVSSSTATQHFFCVIMFDKKMLYDNVDENPYIKLFEDFNYNNYKLFTSKWDYLKFLRGVLLCDKVLIHGNLDVKFQLLSYSLLYITRRRLLGRISLICWGNNDFVKGVRWKTRATLGLIRTKVYSRFRNVITLTEEDKNTVSELYPQANVIYLPYMNGDEYRLNRKQRTEGKIKVMVSHSGWPENNHVRSFEALSTYKNDIEVVCPLCYGDPVYINNVIEKGHTIFGSSFSYFKDLMPIEDYTRFLQTVDIFITAAERQTGLGAIFRVMTGGAKIFLTGNLLTSLRNDGYFVFDLGDVGKTTFKSFSLPISDEQALANVELYNYTHCNGTEIINGWKRVYED